MSLDFLKGILVNDEQSAYDALLRIKINGAKIQGSGIERQVERIIGSRVSSIDAALNVLNDRINKKVKTVEDKINSVAQKLTTDPQNQEAVKQVIDKIVQGRELTTENEAVKSISEVAAEIDVEERVTDEIKVKEVLGELKQAEEADPEAFRQYRMTKYVDSSLDQAKTENKNLTPEHEQLLKDHVTEIAGVTYSKGNIENQKMMVSETFRAQSPGKVKNEFGNLRGLVGFMTSHKKPSKIVKDSDKREEKLRLGGIKIPSNYEADAFDRAKSLLRKDTRSLRRLDSIQGGGSFLVRLKMTFYNFARGWRGGGGIVQTGYTLASGWRGGGGIVQTEGGYLSRVGRQSAGDFVQNSMGVLLQNGFTSGLGSIAKGALGSGVKSALGSLAGDAALKLAGGTLGPIGVAAAKAIGFLKKFLGNTGAKLAPGIKNGLGNAFDKTGSGLGKMAMGLGVLLGSIGFIGTATASTLISGAVVGGIAGSVAYQQYIVPAEMVSGLVTAKKECESRMDWVYTGNRPGIPCENMSKYTKEMRTKILEVGYQTRCAVAVAVQYLIYDFPYFIPYDGGGRGQEDMGIGDDWCDNDSGGAMDCIGLVRWAYRQGGFAIKKSTSTYYWEGGAVITNSWYKTVRPGTYFKTDTISFTENNCAEIKERIQPGDIVRHNRVSEDGSMHAGIVIGVDDTKIHVAQEGNGVNSCFINICTGNSKGLDHGCGGFDRVSLMDNFFNYYIEGTAIDGYPIKPNSDTIYDFKNSLEKE